MRRISARRNVLKFTVSQTAMMRAVSVVSKVLASNATIPALAGVLIRAEGGNVELQATDINASMRHAVQASVEEEGATVASGKVLASVIKNLPDQAVTFDIPEGSTTLIITCGRSKYRLTTIPVADFPEFPDFEATGSVELPSTILIDMANRVFRSLSKDNSRPVLQGMYISVSGTSAKMAATDSYRLSKAEATLNEPCGEFETVVPGIAARDILSAVPGVEMVKIGTGDSQVMFSFGTTTYVSRKIDGTFPNFEQLIPRSFTTETRVGQEEFMSALRRVSVVARANPSVRMDVSEKEMALSASSPEQGESHEVIDCDTEGNEMSITLNHHFLSDCLQGADGEVTVRMNGPMQPAVFQTYGSVSYTCLLMPVRM